MAGRHGARRGAGRAARVQELEQRLARAARRPGHHRAASAHDRALAAYGEAQSRFEPLGGYAVEADAHRVLAGLGLRAGRRGAAAHRPVRRLADAGRPRPPAAGPARRADPRRADQPPRHRQRDLAGGHAVLVRRRDPVRQPRPRLHRRGGRAGDRAGRRDGDGVRRRLRRVRRAARGAAGPAARRCADRQAREIAHVERFVERFRYKATKARQVQSRIKTLEKLERIEVPDHRALVARFGFPPPRRSSRLVAELVDVTVGYDGDAGADATSTSWSSGARSWRSSARTAPARRRCCACCSASWHR